MSRVQLEIIILPPFIEHDITKQTKLPGKTRVAHAEALVRDELGLMLRNVGDVS